MKQLLASTNDVEHVLAKIRRLMVTGQSASPRTCYHKVGLYLHKHPNANGYVHLYGMPGADFEYVAHATLLTSTNMVLVDGYGVPQKQPWLRYDRPDGSYELLKRISVRDLRNLKDTEHGVVK